MVVKFRKMLEKKKLPVTDYYGVERLYIGRPGDPRFKNLTILKTGQILDKVIKNRKERGLEVRIAKLPGNEKVIFVEFNPQITDRVRKRWKTHEEWNKNTGNYSGHAIYIDTRGGVITYELANRGAAELTTKQREEYLKILDALRKFRGK